MIRLDKLNSLPENHKLLSFLWIYRLKSLSAASKHCALSKGALSQSLSQLENELKTPLFKRLHRKMIPTQEAKDFYEVLETSLVNITDQIQILKKQKQEITGHLRIAAPQLISAEVLTKIIKQISKEYPHVYFEVSLISKNSLDLLLEDKLDICILDSPSLTALQESSFRKTFLSKEEEVLAYAPKHWKIPTDPSFEELHNYTYLSYKKDSSDLITWFQKEFGKKPQQLQIILHSDSVFNILSAIKKGLGIGFVPTSFLSKDLKTLTRNSKKNFTNKIYSYQQKGKLETKLEKLFMNKLHKELKKNE